LDVWGNLLWGLLLLVGIWTSEVVITISPKSIELRDVELSDWLLTLVLPRHLRIYASEARVALISLQLPWLWEVLRAPIHLRVVGLRVAVCGNPDAPPPPPRKPRAPLTKRSSGEAGCHQHIPPHPQHANLPLL
jgi:hypothetical protein